MVLATSVREYTYFMFFFQISKKHDFLRFFEMTYQKVVKSLYQKFSPQSVKMNSYTSLSDLSKKFDVGDLPVLTFGN